VPAHAPLPLAGRLMFGALALVPVLVGLGIYFHLPWLWMAGAAIGVIVIAILVVGAHVC